MKLYYCISKDQGKRYDPFKFQQHIGFRASCAYCTYTCPHDEQTYKKSKKSITSVLNLLSNHRKELVVKESLLK